ncbi:MAG: hypothetical protein KAI17_11040, partial [Thiotrichaceae bacterium]|nr:hypothetical protein [Thiotrichaceae bacterium]
MKNIFQLKIILLVLFLININFAATVTAVPSTIPKGAYVNGGDGDQQFFMSLNIHLEAGNGGGTNGWTADTDVIKVTLPSDISVAFVNDLGTLAGHVSFSQESGAAADNGWVLGAVTAQSITIDVGTAVNVSDGDDINIFFPVTTSINPGASTANITITYGDAGVTPDDAEEDDVVTITFTDDLSLTTFTTTYTGGDESSDLGDVYPVAAGAVTAVLPDWVTEVTAVVQAVHNGADFGLGLDNSEGTDEITYYMWASTTTGLKRIDTQSGKKPIAASTAGANIAGNPVTAVNEDDSFANTQLDGTQLEEGTWYFYITSDLTADWILASSDSVEIKHYPVFASGNANASAGGLDFDGDEVFEIANGEDDDEDAMYLESGLVLQPDGDLFTGTSIPVDNVNIFYYVTDYDDNANIDIFYSSSSSITSSDITTTGSSPNEVISGLTGATKINTTVLTEDTSQVFYNWDIYTDENTYLAAGTYYIYLVANDGKHQDFQKINEDGGNAVTVVVKHLPAFSFQDHYSTGIGANGVATESEPYFIINWGETIDGDKDADNNQRIRLYASVHDITNDKAFIGYSTTLALNDSTLLPDLVSTTPTQHCLIADIRDTGDSRRDNRVMWDVQNSGLAAGTYYLYALCTDGSDVVIYQAQSASDDDQTITLSHGVFFQPLNPVEDQQIGGGLTKEDSFELRWNAYDMDITSTNFIVAALLVPDGSSLPVDATTGVVAGLGANLSMDDDNADTPHNEMTDYFWLTSADGDEPLTTVYAEDGKYTVDVSTITKNGDTDAATPQGIYDVYYFYDTDANWANAGMNAVKADGQLEFTGTGNELVAENFKMSPTISALSKGDTIDVDVYVKDTGPDPEFLSIYLDVDDNTYLTVVDQDANTSGIQPFLDESTNFTGVEVENNMMTTASGYTMNYVEWKSGGDALTASLKVLTVQFVASMNAPVNVLQETLVTFSTSGARTTGI